MTTPDEPRGPVPDVDPLDEVASALIDGEATDAERARAAEPEVVARMATFEAVVRRMALPVEPPTAAQRERAVLAALVAADEPDRADEEIVSLAARRGRPPTWLPAVAAVVVVLAGFGLYVAAAGTSSDSEDSATAGPVTDAAAEAGGGAFGGAGVDEEATFEAPSAGSSAEGAPPNDLGDLADLDALEDAARAYAAPFEAARDTDAGTTQTLAVVPCQEFVGEPLVVAATARLEGRAVTVAVLGRAGEGGLTYVVLDQVTCQQVAAGDL